SVKMTCVNVSRHSLAANTVNGSAAGADERVVGALVGDRRLLHVARQDARVVGQDKQTLADAAQDLIGIAAGQVGATNRLTEQRIAAEQEPGLRRIKAR